MDDMLNGYMGGDAFTSPLYHMPMPSIEEIMRLLKDVLQLYASYGIITMQDGMINTAVYAILKEATTRNILKQDVVGYVGIRNNKAP